MADHDLDGIIRRALEEDDLEASDDVVGRLVEERISRGGLLRRGVAAGIGFSALASPAGALASGSRFLKSPPSSGRKISMKELVAEAKKEGHLNVIALPRDWANYGAILDTFKRKYGISLTEDNPNGSSSQENQALRSLKGQSRAPDVVDVSPTFAIAGASEGLYAVYKNRNFANVPRAMKDGRGYWVGDYWGVVALGANRNVIKNMPRSWADLAKPEYKGKVALNGDPRTSGSAIAGVFSASIANGGSLNDIGPGIDYFAKLKKLGNFIPVDATPATVASGQTPITIDWDYLQLAYGKEFAKSGLKWSVGVPARAVYGAYYCQAINATAPHPWAARLWQEFLYSTTGQLLWLKGYSHPALFQFLVKRHAVPKALIKALPSAKAYAGVHFASPGQLARAKAKIAAEWGPKVAGS
jgi:putative spermidine/putrescine transport system substrate-binding protein